jgi:hypothetical protein
MARKKAIPDEDLRAAAREIQQLAGAYLKAEAEADSRRLEWETLTRIQQDLLPKADPMRFRRLRMRRAGPVARKLEPILRRWLTEYQPQLQSRRREFELRLASLAWQLHWAPAADLQLFVEAAVEIRRGFDSADNWPGGTDVAAEINRIRSAPKMRELARASAIYEVFGSGYVKHDNRRGVRRGARYEVLLLARDIVLNMWIEREADRTRIPADEHGNLALYHRASREAAERILRNGFERAASGMCGPAASEFRLSEAPLDVSAGGQDQVLLRVHLDATPSSLAQYECIEHLTDHGEPLFADSKLRNTPREWQVPATLLASARTEVVNEDYDNGADETALADGGDEDHQPTYVTCSGAARAPALDVGGPNDSMADHDATPEASPHDAATAALRNLPDFGNPAAGGYEEPA